MRKQGKITQFWEKELKNLEGQMDKGTKPIRAPLEGNNAVQKLRVGRW